MRSRAVPPTLLVLALGDESDSESFPKRRGVFSAFSTRQRVRHHDARGRYAATAANPSDEPLPCRIHHWREP
jgi:hypothetical protein